MEILIYIKMFQIVLAFLALLVAIITGILLFRFRGIMNWRRSLTKELKHLKKQTERLDGPHRKAQEIVVQTCEDIQQSFIANINIFNQLPDYIHQIALCYNPDKEQPELCISIGNSLLLIQEIAFRLDLVFKKPGLNRFRNLRLRHIKNMYQQLKKIQNNPLFLFYLKYRKAIQKISFIRLFILPDPISWLFYFSNQFTVITITRYLLLDIYLYVGRLAVSGYGQKGKQAISLSAEELELLILDFEKCQPVVSTVNIPQLSNIRKKKLGFGKGLLSELSFAKWKEAIVDSSMVIAAHHFPDSEQPLLEVSVGPLIDRCRYFVKTINKIQSIPVVYKMADVKIEVFFQAKLILDNIPPTLKQAISSTMKLYRWAKWPMTIYRLAQKMTPVGMAVSLGWMFTRNCLVCYVYHYSFYYVCDEMNMIYHYSKEGITHNPNLNIDDHRF